MRTKPRPRVLLVKPPERSAFNFGAFSLGVLAAAIQPQAEVKILDTTTWSPERVVRAVLREQPDLLGLTTMGIKSVPPVAALIEGLRCTPTGAKLTILVGGHGAAMLPEALLRAGADGVVYGEGEATLQAILAEGLRPGLPGLALLQDGQLMMGSARPPIRPLDQLPWPARELMPPPPDGVHLMETSRGCPHACAFCETTRFYGRMWRPHTPARVTEEVRQLVERYDAWVIHLADDNFAADHERVLEICARLVCGPLPAFFLASARADDLAAEPRLIPALAAARILRISVGVETVDPPTAARAGKTIGAEIYRAVFERMRAEGLFSVASFIVGLPGETPEARAQALALALQIAPDSAHFLPFLPLPGTPLATGYASSDPAPADVEDAARLSRQFAQHATVRTRLEAAVAAGGVRGLLARGTLERTAE